MDAILAFLSTSYPAIGGVLLVLWLVFGDRIKALFKKTVPGQPDSADVLAIDKWLEQHPLLDRVWVRVKEKFTDLLKNTSEDDAYSAILDALKKVSAPK